MLIQNEAIADNDLIFLSTLDIAVKYSDPEAILTHKRNLNSLVITIMPSLPEFKQEIITNLVGLHRMLGMKVIFSKSLKISKTITFTINLEDIK